MATENIIKLAEYVDQPYTDMISGREYGESKASDLNLLDRVKKNEHFKIVIDGDVIKAINDSFIKGFFKDVFEYLRSKDAVSQLFEIEGNAYFTRLFEKNFTILDAIYNKPAKS